MDVSEHLRDVHLRPAIARHLLEELIERGFPSYDAYSVEDIKRRTRTLYGTPGKLWRR